MMASPNSPASADARALNVHLDRAFLPQLPAPQYLHTDILVFPDIPHSTMASPGDAHADAQPRPDAHADHPQDSAQKPVKRSWR